MCSLSRLLCMRFLVLISLLFISFASNAQSSADWWYFGLNAGVHFESTGPVADTNGLLYTFEGCASISNNSGDLLFYTDGRWVFNAIHDTMPNGFGLLGNSSSSQSAIIVPHPGNPSLYYIVTVPVSTTLGIRYTLVNMNLDGGLGDVDTTEKNVFLIDGTGENVCAVKNASGQGLWIVTHLSYSDTVAAFEITNSGFNTTPVLSDAGDSINGFVGSIKGSANGNYICHAAQTSQWGNGGSIKLMKFNNAIGEIDSALSWSSTIVSGPYSAEFSIDEKVLYISDGWGATVNYAIAQYDISLYDLAAIQTSEYMVADSISFGQIQMGPDGNIYCASRLGSQFPGVDSFLHRINDPEILGAGCNFEPKAVHLGGRVSTMGLPPFLSSIFNTSFEFSQTCKNDSTHFVMDTAGVTSAIWNFGDPASGTSDTSTQLNPVHLFTDTGWFVVTLVATSDTLVDTTVSNVYVYPRQTIDLGPDTTICAGDILTLFATNMFSQYLWNDSSTLDSLITNGDSIVWVNVLGVCDTVSDTLSIFYDDLLSFDLGPDTLLCGGDSFRLSTGNTNSAVVQWSTGDSIETIYAKISGTYEVNVINACGSLNDTIQVLFKPTPSSILLPADTINCFDNEIVLTHADLDSVNYIWSDSSSKKNYRVDTTETVWLAAFNDCGTTIDTINIIFNPEIVSELGNDTTICDLDTIVLNAYSPGAEYVWSTGDTIDTIYTAQVSQLYVVTVTQGLCQTIESKRVDLSNVFCPGIDCSLKVGNVFTPNGDGVNDVWRVSSDCDIVSFGLNIYNRWGQLIHTSDNAMFGWDGAVYGTPAAEGVYYYELVFKDSVIVDVDNLDFKGSITLIR